MIRPSWIPPFQPGGYYRRRRRVAALSPPVRCVCIARARRAPGAAGSWAPTEFRAKNVQEADLEGDLLQAASGFVNIAIFDDNIDIS
jgi:hypothetical protein